MQKRILLLPLLPFLLAAAPANKPAPPPALPSSSQPADVTTALKAGSALALVEVVSITDKDNTPADGNHDLIIALKLLKSSGSAPTEVRITLEYGGRRVGGPPIPKGPLFPNPLVAKQHYWMVFTADTSGAYPQGVIAWWPEAAAPTTALEAAITENRFAKTAPPR